MFRCDIKHVRTLFVFCTEREKGALVCTEKERDRDSRGVNRSIRVRAGGGGVPSAAGRARRSPFQGFGKRYGWATELTLIMPGGRRVEWMEVLDAVRGRLVGLRRWWNDGALSRVEVMNMCPKGQ